MSVEPRFYDHEIVQKSPDDYVELRVSPRQILKAWSMSLFAHELLGKDGQVKDKADIKDETLQRYVMAEESMKRGEDLAKPIIGIGIMDGIEIGIGREIVAVADVMGVSDIPIHVRKAQADEVRAAL